MCLRAGLGLGRVQVPFGCAVLCCIVLHCVVSCCVVVDVLWQRAHIEESSPNWKLISQTHSTRHFSVLNKLGLVVTSYCASV